MASFEPTISTLYQAPNATNQSTSFVLVGLYSLLDQILGGKIEICLKFSLFSLRKYEWNHDHLMEMYLKLRN